jgi:integrase/recombinase XerD
MRSIDRVRGDVIMSTSGIIRRPDAGPARIKQAHTDEQTLELWLHDRPHNTRLGYERDVRQLLASTGKPLPLITLADLQDYSDTLNDKAPSTKSRVLSSIKSLFTFSYNIGYLTFNVAAAIRVHKVPNTAGSRVLTERQIIKMLDLEKNRRNHALIRLLYVAGLRVSEAIGIRWSDLQERPESGQVTVMGKGGKQRSILLSGGTWDELNSLRSRDAAGEGHVFVTKSGRAIGRSEAYKIIRAAGKRTGLPKISPHWLRHSHATHALEKGAPLHLVKETLGHASLTVTSIYVHARPDDSSARYLVL